MSGKMSSTQTSFNIVKQYLKIQRTLFKGLFLKCLDQTVFINRASYQKEQILSQSHI